MEATEHVLVVDGMSCDHCVAAVTAGAGAVAGVQSVDVDLEAGRVVVAGGERAAVEAAIDDAGFEVVS